MEIKFLQKRKKIIAIENGKVIGHLRFNYPNDHSNRRNINIHDIYVKPEHRIKGIATQMIQTFLDNSRGKIVWASLWTNEEMETNKTYGLYKKLGFEELAHQPDYYKKGIGTRLFVKRLKE